MKLIHKHIISSFLLLLFYSCSKEDIVENGFGSVQGKVVKEITFEPLANVKISTNPNSSTVFTDSLGYFKLDNVPAGTYSLQAQKDGFVAKFESITVIINNTIQANVELKELEEDNSPPTAPVLTAPADNAIDLPLSVNLTWSSSDPDEGDVLKYNLIIRNDTDNEIITINDIEQSNYTITNLKYSTKYYWQIGANDGVNPVVLSTISTFKTAIFPNARFLFTRNISGNNVIFTANDAGNQLQITSNSNNCYRPKRNTQINRIAYIRTDNGQEHIYTMKPDGSDVLRITNSVPIAGFNMNYVSFSWSGNGSQILYPNFNKLYKINADGSGLSLFYQSPSGRFISECDWSIDGSFIAVKTNTIDGYNAEIIILDASGNLVQTVVSGFTGAIGSLHFSVTNQKLLFTRDISGFESPDYRQLDTFMFVYDFITSTSTQITANKTAGTNDIDARFSPNEAEVVVMNTSNDGVSIKNIQRINLSGNTRTTLFTNGFMPDWR